MIETTDTQAVPPVEKYLLDQMYRIRETGTTRAALRRGANNLGDLTVNPMVYRGFPANLRRDGSPTRYDLAARDTLCVYALMASGGKDTHRSDAGNLGSSLQEVALSRGNLPSDDTLTVRLYNRLVSAKTRETLVPVLIDVIRAVSRYGIPVNYVRLYYSLSLAYGNTRESITAASEWGSSYSHVVSRKQDEKKSEGDALPSE